MSGPETCDIGLEARLLKRVFVGSQFYDRALASHIEVRDVGVFDDLFSDPVGSDAYRVRRDREDGDVGRS